MAEFRKLSDEEVDKVVGGGRTDIEPSIEESIPQIDENALLTGIKNGDQGGLTPAFSISGCTYDEGQDYEGHRLFCCSDVPNQGLKPECATCPARK